MTVAASGAIIRRMTDISERITELRAKGWTVAAIADELQVNYYTVVRWQNQSRLPTNSAGVRMILERLIRRKRIPKRRRYGPDAPQRRPRKGPEES